MSEAACHDFGALRQVALCAAWHEHMRSPEPRSFGARVHRAWSEMRTKCAPHGGIRPEQGFMRPVSAWTLHEQGQPVGVIVEEPDGSLSVCVHGTCHVVSGVGANTGAFAHALGEITGHRYTAVPESASSSG